MRECLFGWGWGCQRGWELIMKGGVEWCGYKSCILSVGDVTNGRRLGLCVSLRSDRRSDERSGGCGGFVPVWAVRREYLAAGKTVRWRCRRKFQWAWEATGRLLGAGEAVGRGWVVSFGMWSNGGAFGSGSLFPIPDSLRSLNLLLFFEISTLPFKRFVCLNQLL